MACGAKMFVIKPSGINSATLEFEQAHHVERLVDLQDTLET